MCDFMVQSAALEDRRNRLLEEANKIRMLKAAQVAGLGFRAQLCIYIGSALVSIGQRLQEPYKAERRRAYQSMCF